MAILLQLYKLKKIYQDSYPSNHQNIQVGKLFEIRGNLITQCLRFKFFRSQSNPSISVTQINNQVARLNQIESKSTNFLAKIVLSSQEGKQRSMEVHNLEEEDSALKLRLAHQSKD